MNENDMDRDALRDLLADHATQGLSFIQQQQLGELLTGDLLESEEMELTAARIQLAKILPEDPLPAPLRRKIGQQAAAFFQEKKRVAAGQPGQWKSLPRLSWSSWLGWAVAAVFLIALATQIHSNGDKSESNKRLLHALAARPGTVRIPWSATADPAAAGLTGELVWNERENRGYMTFHHLAANDAKTQAYQLWIFADNQDERFPVDGGVFHVPSLSGEVIVPINPRIHVTGAKMFAVTVERNGGVVVSKRERIVSVAKIS